MGVGELIAVVIVAAVAAGIIGGLAGAMIMRRTVMRAAAAGSGAELAALLGELAAGPDPVRETRRELYAAFLGSLREEQEARDEPGTRALDNLRRHLGQVQIAGPEPVARLAGRLVDVLGQPAEGQAEDDFLAAARAELGTG